LILITPRLAQSQTKYKNFVFTEIGGSAYWYSINYERQFTSNKNIRVGICYYNEIFVVPVMLGKVYGHKNHHVEISGGLDLVYNTNTDTFLPTPRYMLAATAFIGYRYQDARKPFFVKGGFTPIWTFYDSTSDFSNPNPVFPWAGVGIGYRF
jgi:hypothetical protein